jgi:hypothetical protein
MSSGLFLTQEAIINIQQRLDVVNYKLDLILLAQGSPKAFASTGWYDMEWCGMYSLYNSPGCMTIG